MFLPSTIGNLTQLEYLDVDYTNLRDMPNELRQCRNLTFFNMRHSYVDPDAALRIRKMLPDDCIKLFPLTCNCN